MHDWERRYYDAIPNTTEDASDWDFAQLMALASEAGRQATYWQSRAEQVEVRMQELKVVLGWGEGRKDEDQQARIADLQARIRQQEGHIEDLNALVDRLLEALPRIMEALAIMRNPHDGPGEGKESPVPGDRKDPQGVRQDKISDALAP
jgi:TolA-binding protein